MIERRELSPSKAGISFWIQLEFKKACQIYKTFFSIWSCSMFFQHATAKFIQLNCSFFLSFDE